MLVSQRLPFTAKDTPLDAEGKLSLVQSADGLHVVDVATGETHGVLPGEYSWPMFARGSDAAMRVRSGPDVERSPMGSLTLLGERRRAGLFGELVQAP